jgi:Holliday junction resolvasome RuvABC ATP-dependent DNA helicase subunit
MTFNDFIGQDQIKKELVNLAGHSVHILLRGLTGCGKTTLAELTAALRGDYDVVSARNITQASFNPQAVTHILDEAHCLVQPELLYGIMETAPFIFCTTESGELPETLRNRCIVLTLQPYTIVELETLGGRTYPFDASVLALLANRARQTPRVMLNLCLRVQINLRPDPDYFMVKQFLTDVGVFEHGYTTDDINYLSILAQVGRASAATMSSMLNVPLTSILEEIEPFLLRRGDIHITSRGRTLTNGTHS